MCTQARLVQGGQVSQWLGMPMANGQSQPVGITLVEGQPAYVEVKIDPTAHGLSGVGPITRGVTLKTSGAQQLDFELKGTIVN